MLNRKFIKSIVLIAIISFFILSCSTKKGMIHTSAKLPSMAKVGVVIDSPNNLKNVALVTFMKEGLRVKAFNASDLYSMKDIFDIADMKKISYKIKDKNAATVSTFEKTYENIYKLHVYNFELDKASALQQLRNNWDVDFLIVLDLKNWEHVSWARVINLRTLDIEFIENYPAKYNDNIETIVTHFAKNIISK